MVGFAFIAFAIVSGAVLFMYCLGAAMNWLFEQDPAVVFVFFVLVLFVGLVMIGHK